MNKEIKELWLESLEGGSYPKGTDECVTIDKSGNIVGYCCLGVLGDLYNKARPWDACNLVGNAFPDMKVYEWAGIDLAGTKAVSVAHAISLSRQNDHGPNKDKDFSDVIPLIREHL